MKKLLLFFIVILSIFTLFSCVTKTSDSEKAPIDLDNVVNENNQELQLPSSEVEPIKDEKTAEQEAQASKEKDALMVAGNENEALNEDIDNSYEAKQSFILKAIVKSVEDNHIEVEVIESDYAFGVYWILTPSTKYYNKNGSQITRQSITVGETVEISYSGQTMLSFPPQVVAYQIRIAD